MAFRGDGWIASAEKKGKAGKRNSRRCVPKHVPLASRCRHLFRHERPEASSQYDARQINDTVENLRYDCNEGSANQEAHETARSAVHAGGDHVCV